MELCTFDKDNASWAVTEQDRIQDGVHDRVQDEKGEIKTICTISHSRNDPNRDDLHARYGTALSGTAAA